jgi:hypothetical protein
MPTSAVRLNQIRIEDPCVVQLLFNCWIAQRVNKLADFRLRPRRVTRSQVLPEVSPLEVQGELFLLDIVLLWTRTFSFFDMD